MKANNLKSGAASSFQGHSRNTPDCAFDRHGHVQEDGPPLFTHHQPMLGSKQLFLGLVAHPSKQQTGRCSRQCQGQDAESPPSQALSPPDCPVVQTQNLDTEPCVLRPASGQGEAARGHARDKDTHAYNALPLPFTQLGR